MTREEAIQVLTEWQKQMHKCGVPEWSTKLEAIDMAIEALSEVRCNDCKWNDDVIEVVRCKDCEYKSDWNGVYNHDTELFCYLHECGMDNDDFCSRAKMKGGAE